MELVLLAVTLQLRFERVDVLGRRILVLVAEDAEQRARQILRVLDRRDRPAVRELLRRGDDSASPHVAHRVEGVAATCGEEAVSANGGRAADTGAADADRLV